MYHKKEKETQGFFIWLLPNIQRMNMSNTAQLVLSE